MVFFLEISFYMNICSSLPISHYFLLNSFYFLIHSFYLKLSPHSSFISLKTLSVQEDIVFICICDSSSLVFLSKIIFISYLILPPLLFILSFSSVTSFLSFRIPAHDAVSWLLSFYLFYLLLEYQVTTLHLCSDLVILGWLYWL